MSDETTKAQEAARKWLQETEQKQATAICEAGVPTEQELRESPDPWPQTMEELTAIIDGLVDRPHDYETCVHAMSLSAVAAFHYVAHRLGVSSFQASCADLDFLRRTRNYEHGFGVIDYNNLLYPQYADLIPGFETLLDENAERLQPEAERLLAQQPAGSPAVRAHWRRIVNLGKSAGGNEA